MHRAVRASDRRSRAQWPLNWVFSGRFSRFTGVLYRFTGVPYFRFTGVPYFRFTGVLYFRFTGVKSRVPMKSGRGRGAENGSTQVFSTLL